MVLILDNYDSFSYNLYQYIGSCGVEVKVCRNDEITVSEILKMSPSHLVISPGPGFPKDAGISIEAIRKIAGKIPILGVCLGHQSIGEAFGGRVVHAPRLMHGKTSGISLDSSCPLFRGLPGNIEGMRYHSLVVERQTLPGALRITAADGEGEIMGMMHTQLPVYGLQFHPESFMTQYGFEMIQNFLSL